jgi:inner membrane protein
MSGYQRYLLILSGSAPFCLFPLFILVLAIVPAGHGAWTDRALAVTLALLLLCSAICASLPSLWWAYLGHLSFREREARPFSLIAWLGLSLAIAVFAAVRGLPAAALCWGLRFLALNYEAVLPAVIALAAVRQKLRTLPPARAAPREDQRVRREDRTSPARSLIEKFASASRRRHAGIGIWRQPQQSHEEVMHVQTALKLVVISVISLVLLAPLAMIQGLVGERKSLRDGVVAGIAQDSVDAQRIIGPVILVPYKRHIVETATEEKDGKTTTKRWERIVEGRLAFLPDRLAITGDLVPEERHRGIYSAIAYQTRLGVKGHFTIPQAFGIAASLAEYELAAPRLVFGISDLRGLVGSGLQLDWQGAAIPFAPGADAPGFSAGIKAPLPSDIAGRGFDFTLSADLLGLGRIDFVPTGQETSVQVSSSWPDPSFLGRYLPRSNVSEAGFSATWQTSVLSTNVVELYQRCLSGSCGDFVALAHGVALYQPVDLYQQLERSTKYAVLFVGLIFAAFFLNELLSGLRIHPIQYGLVGLALATFYLLLISLTEVIGFPIAYSAAALASVALIGFYLCHVLGSLARGMLFSGLLSGLFAMLFVIVRAEEHALLMGSVALFLLLAAVMIGTRRIDWYRIEVPQLQTRPTGVAEAGIE